VSYTNLSPFRDARYYDPRDLAVIADLIAANGLTEASSPSDADNGDGKLDPLEVGYQVWCGGRLREFRTGPNQFSSFGYGIQNVPDSLAQLDQLEELDLSGNAIQQLPTSLSDLQNLRALRLAGNQIEQFPTTAMTMGNLQELVLRDNRIQAVPAAIGNMGNLRELHVDGNPIVNRPDQVMQQRISQGFDRGLQARQGAVVRTGGDCQVIQRKG
jgi:hypothetical protein